MYQTYQIKNEMDTLGSTTSSLISTNHHKSKTRVLSTSNFEKEQMKKDWIIQRQKALREQEKQISRGMINELKESKKKLKQEEDYLQKYQSYQEKLRMIEELKKQKEAVMKGWEENQRKLKEEEERKKRQAVEDKKRNRRRKKLAKERGKAAIEKEEENIRLMQEKERKAALMREAALEAEKMRSLQLVEKFRERKANEPAEVEIETLYDHVNGIKDGRGLKRRKTAKDFENTTSHNYFVVREQPLIENEAIKNAEELRNNNMLVNMHKEQNAMNMKKRAAKRGRNAINKIKSLNSQKELEEVAEAERMKEAMKKIEQGKKVGMKPIHGSGAHSLKKNKSKRQKELNEQFEFIFMNGMVTQNQKHPEKNGLIRDRIELLAYWKEPEEIFYEVKKNRKWGPKNKKRLFKAPTNELPGVKHHAHKLEREVINERKMEEELERQKKENLRRVQEQKEKQKEEVSFIYSDMTNPDDLDMSSLIQESRQLDKFETSQNLFTEETSQPKNFRKKKEKKRVFIKQANENYNKAEGSLFQHSPSKLKLITENSKGNTENMYQYQDSLEHSKDSNIDYTQSPNDTFEENQQLPYSLVPPTNDHDFPLKNSALKNLGGGNKTQEEQNIDLKDYIAQQEDFLKKLERDRKMMKQNLYEKEKMVFDDIDNYDESDEEEEEMSYEQMRDHLMEIKEESESDETEKSKQARPKPSLYNKLVDDSVEEFEKYERRLIKTRSEDEDDTPFVETEEDLKEYANNQLNKEDEELAQKFIRFKKEDDWDKDDDEDQELRNFENLNMQKTDSKKLNVIPYSNELSYSKSNSKDLFEFSEKTTSAKKNKLSFAPRVERSRESMKSNLEKDQQKDFIFISGSKNTLSSSKKKTVTLAQAFKKKNSQQVIRDYQAEEEQIENSPSAVEREGKKPEVKTGYKRSKEEMLALRKKMMNYNPRERSKNTKKYNKGKSKSRTKKSAQEIEEEKISKNKISKKEMKNVNKRLYNKLPEVKKKKKDMKKEEDRKRRMENVKKFNQKLRDDMKVKRKTKN